MAFWMNFFAMSLILIGSITSRLGRPPSDLRSDARGQTYAVSGVFEVPPARQVGPGRFVSEDSDRTHALRWAQRYTEDG